MINEHENTKNMLSLIRELRDAPNINMGTNADDDANADANADTNVDSAETNDSIQLEGSERENEVQKIKQGVAPRIIVDEETPIIYPYDNNVVLRGEFEGLRFEMSTSQGLFLTASSLKINDNDIVGIIKKLDGYFDVWRDEWADKINEYKKDLK